MKTNSGDRKLMGGFWSIFAAIVIFVSGFFWTPLIEAGDWCEPNWVAGLSLLFLPLSVPVCGIIWICVFLVFLGTNRLLRGCRWASWVFCVVGSFFALFLECGIFISASTGGFRSFLFLVMAAVLTGTILYFGGVALQLVPFRKNLPESETAEENKTL